MSCFRRVKIVSTNNYHLMKLECEGKKTPECWEQRIMPSFLKLSCAKISKIIQPFYITWERDQQIFF